MQYRNDTYTKNKWDTYWFEKNLQGDILGVYDYAGNCLVYYEYDSWGKVSISYSDNGASTSAAKNSLTYRGYYYDKDLGLYYLISRYYDANIGRFISADHFISVPDGSLHGYNLYSYAFNNPINAVDNAGNWPQLITSIKKAAKWLVKNVAKPITDGIQELLSETDGAYSVGYSASASPGIVTGSVQLMVTVDTKGNIALQGSYSGGFTTGSAGASFAQYQSIANVPSYKYLQDMSAQIGGSYGFNIGCVPVTAGGDIAFMTVDESNYYGLPSYFGVGGSPGPEVHATWGETTTFGKINVFEQLDGFYKKVLGW